MAHQGERILGRNRSATPEANAGRSQWSAGCGNHPRWVANLLMVAGCGAVEPTTQTSMLRGPTPSSGMSIPQLFQIPSPSTGAQQDAQPVDPAASVAPATEESPTDAPISEIP